MEPEALAHVSDEPLDVALRAAPVLLRHPALQQFATAALLSRLARFV